MEDEHRSFAAFFGASWEAQAREALESAGHDPDLGIRAARDALRVVVGDLPEQEFYSRHHESYLREFGVDARPLLPADGRVQIDDDEDASRSHASSERTEHEHTLLSRRAALRLAGTGAAALFLGEILMRSPTYGASLAEDAEQPNVPPAGADAVVDRPVRWGMVIDLEHCNGCLICAAACHSENGLSDGVHWIYPLAFTDENLEKVNMLVRPCQHCSNSTCAKVCPVGARHVRASDGLVLTDYDLCIGCRYCEVACPYGSNYFQWAEPATYGGTFSGERRDERGRAVIGDPPRGMMGKCTMCPQRIDATGHHETTACALACPHEAIIAGDLNDPESPPRRYLERRRQENPNLSTFRLLDELGTQPNIVYIGQEPTRNAKPVTGPTRFEDIGLIEDRRAVLEGPDAWFTRMIRRG